MGNGAAHKSKTKHRIRTLAATAALAAAAVLSIIFKTQVRGLFGITGLESIYAQAEHYPISIYFPDMGSAGCALIHSEGNGNILIDCGREKAQNNILTTLSYLDITDIDLAVMTHPDSDHLGNFPEVIRKTRVSSFVTCEYSKGLHTQLYGSLVSALEDSGIEAMYAHTGDVLTVGDITFEVLSPAKLYTTANDNSVVLKMSFDGFTALFTGDISSKAETDILASGADVSADLLCVSHHGSGGSSREEFLRAVSPQIAVISVEESEYLPNGSAIARLAATGCEIYRTDISGTVAIFYDGTVKAAEEHAAATSRRSQYALIV